MVYTAERIGDVIPEKRMESNMMSADSSKLRNTEIRMGIKKIFPPLKKRIAKRARVETVVTTDVVAVSPRHLPIIIASILIGFGRIRKNVFLSTSL